MTVSFHRSETHIKTTREWATLAPRGSVESAAKAYAKANMVAGVMLANDDVVLYIFDVANDRIAKQVCKNPTWVN
jgi:hypothetical protein